MRGLSTKAVDKSVGRLLRLGDGRSGGQVITKRPVLWIWMGAGRESWCLGLARNLRE